MKSGRPPGLQGSFARWGGLAALLGGSFWLIKGLSILATGIQPPLLFEIAPLLLALGLVGLHARLGGRGGKPAMIGLILAVISASLNVVSLINFSTLGEESFSPWIFGGFLANLASLIFLGLRSARISGVLPNRARWLPLILGISTFPLVIIGGIMLEPINERFLEVPLVLIALAWIYLGYQIASQQAADDTGQTI